MHVIGQTRSDGHNGFLTLKFPQRFIAGATKPQSNCLNHVDVHHMIHQDAKILTGPGTPPAVCSVNSRTLLSEFAHHHQNTPHAYLLVEDEQGQPLGVVAVDEVRTRLNSPNLSERRRWHNMPVEAALNGRFCARPPALGTVSRRFYVGIQQTQNCIAVSQDERLVALVTPDDLLVSWRSIEQMVRQSQCDHVTGLPVRSVFDTCLRAECARARREEHSVGVILIDVDHFKGINDSFGHAGGDAVLGTIGRNLRSSFRSYDMVARYGGDEFAVLCCGCLPGEIDSTIERVRNGIQKLQSVASIPCRIPTLSIGACVVHDMDQIESPDQIIESADECLYLAKHAGRNRSFSTEIGVESVAVC